jgi:PAS domain S-box-containing protein
MKRKDLRHEGPDRERDAADGDNGSDRGREFYSSSADKTREELEATKEYAEMVVNTIREGLLILNMDLTVRSANRSFYECFDESPETTEGRLVYELGNGQWDIPELRQLLEEILPENKYFNDFEVTHDFAGIGQRTMLLNARRLNHHQLILLAIEDVTERRRGIRRLRESQERFDLLVENAREYAIFLMDHETRITVWNPGAERILGWAEEEILGQTGDIIFTPEDREAGVPEMELGSARETGSALDDRWHVRKDGKRFWATGFMVALDDGDGLRGYAKILRDDTRKKAAEMERRELISALEQEREELRQLNETLEERVAERTRQVRALASTLTMAEQQERRRISQVLHDDLQQQLHSVQMKLALLRRRAETRNPDDEAVRGFSEAETWLAGAIATTRSLTVDLSPPLLRGEGLVDALHWLVPQMERMHGLKVDLTAEHSFRIPDEDIRVLLFQIVRELLFNVVKHADIDRAKVRLVQLDGHFMIEVRDEGTGFSVEEAEERCENGGGLGLFSSRERLVLFGGRLEIESAPGQGTTVKVITPEVL